MAAESLAQGIVASGSSDSKWGRFPGATDGKKGTPWHGRPGDMPATLALNLGLPTTVAGMSILTWPGENCFGGVFMGLRKPRDALKLV